MNATITLAKAMDRALRQAGYLRRSKTWHLDAEETTLVVDLQKSDFGLQYYVNLAAFVKTLGNIRFPKEWKCHVRIRLASLEPLDEYFVARVLDLENKEFEMVERQKILFEYIQDHAIPFLKSLGTLSGIIQAHVQGVLDNAFVHRDVTSQLNLT